jgi:ubiquitin carboxyl-terminal hydrolase 9/13
MQSPASPAANAAPAKRDPNAPQPTPLEKLLADAGPIRADGSDKFFGFENVCDSALSNSVYGLLTPPFSSSEALGTQPAPILDDPSADPR